METWINDAIMDGLSRLLCLGLDRTPASDLIEGTAAMWAEALTEGRVWDEQLDGPRFHKAFVKLSQIRRTWPAPADFLEALPPREQLALTKQPIKANPERAEQAARELAGVLGGRR